MPRRIPRELAGELRGRGIFGKTVARALRNSHKKTDYDLLVAGTKSMLSGVPDAARQKHETINLVALDATLAGIARQATSTGERLRKAREWKPRRPEIEAAIASNRAGYFYRLKKTHLRKYGDYFAAGETPKEMRDSAEQTSNKMAEWLLDHRETLDVLFHGWIRPAVKPK